MTVRTLLVATLLLSPMVMMACENDCQQMCREFADIWEECGIAHADSELKDCIEEYRIPDKTKLETVCEYGMRQHEEHGTIMRADMVASADTGDICTTVDDWLRTVGTSE
jgi:hypothetical protein